MNFEKKDAVLFFTCDACGDDIGVSGNAAYYDSFDHYERTGITFYGRSVFSVHEPSDGYHNLCNRFSCMSSNRDFYVLGSG